MENLKALLQRLWNGDLPLAQTFWIFYVMVLIGLRIVALAFGPVIGVLALLWAGFMVMPIWRAANKYTGNNIFSLLAKVAAVLIALGVLGTLL